jgi:PAS domain S-box-containing protein
MDSIILTSGQAAGWLGISKRTLMRAVSRGDVRPVSRSPGGWLRFHADDVDAYARLLASRRDSEPPATISPSDPAAEFPENHYRLISELTSDYAYSFAVLADGTRVLEWMSGAFEAVTGYTLDDMHTESVLVNLIYLDDLPIVAERTRALLDGQPSSFEYRIRTKEGGIRTVRDYARPLWDERRTRVIRIVGAARDITNQKQAEQEALRGREAAEELSRLRKDQAEEAEAMARMGAALSSSLEPTALYNIILEQAAHLLPMDTSCVFLVQDDWAVVAATWGQPNPPVGARAFHMDDRLRSRWPKAGDPPLYRPDMRLVPGRTPREPWVGKDEVRSIITVPLALDGELLGALDVASTRANYYAERHIRIAATLGDRVTQALRNARLYAAEQERSRVAEELAGLRQEQIREAEALAGVSVALAGALDPSTVYQVILEQAARVLPFDYAEIALYKDGWVVSVATLGGPEIPPDTALIQVDPTTSTWQALMRGECEYLVDTAELPDWTDIPPWTGAFRVRSMVIVPLLIDGVLIGSFKVSSYAPRFYNERDIHMATVFGERAVQAVRNARLYAAEQARARAAEELMHVRSDFLASVSHELRTPLAAIVGFGELLQARWHLLGEAKRLEHINHIVQAANRQQRLVEDLLAIGKIESARVAPACVMLELAPLLKQAVVEVQASYVGQSIILQGPPATRVWADGASAIQVLVNLLDNAAKYSPEGSPIAVDWEVVGKMVVVRVVDRGPGVPEQGRDRLFTQFGRMQGSRIRAGRVGTGLGLHISRGLVEAMGGDLVLETTGPEGSTFRLRLPRVPTEADLHADY